MMRRVLTQVPPCALLMAAVARKSTGKPRPKPKTRRELAEPIPAQRLHPHAKICMGHSRRPPPTSFRICLAASRSRQAAATAAEAAAGSAPSAGRARPFALRLVRQCSVRDGERRRKRDADGCGRGGAQAAGTGAGAGAAASPEAAAAAGTERYPAAAEEAAARRCRRG